MWRAIVIIDDGVDAPGSGRRKKRVEQCGGAAGGADLAAAAPLIAAH